jgi:PhzF family phenazine biosynthesis protein
MRQWTIDAFADRPLSGNPACVVEPLDSWPGASEMQALAAENNQAETAFLLKTADADRFGLRWFTPAVEVPLCGHATLASAHALFEELGLAARQVTFDTQSGPLAVSRHAGVYEMDFPADPAHRVACPAALAEALGAAPAEVWAGSFLAVILEDEAAVRTLRPNLAALADLGVEASRGPGNIGVAAPTTSAGADVVSCFFAPGSGIPEDPATGSWHCLLAPLFSAKLGKPTLKFHQAYPGRGGDLEVEDKGARVALRGRAVTIMDSRLRLSWRAMS